MAIINQERLTEWAAQFLVGSEWGKTDCLSFAVSYLSLWGVEVKLPGWVLSEGSEEEVKEEALRRYGALGDAYASVMDADPRLDRCVMGDLRGPPAISMTPEKGVEFNGIVYEMPGASLMVMLWDGWFVRTPRGILRVDSQPVRIWTLAGRGE